MRLCSVQFCLYRLRSYTRACYHLAVAMSDESDISSSPTRAMVCNKVASRHCQAPKTIVLAEANFRRPPQGILFKSCNYCPMIHPFDIGTFGVVLVDSSIPTPTSRTNAVVMCRSVRRADRILTLLELQQDVESLLPTTR